jgi:hypothetical protein
MRTTWLDVLAVVAIASTLACWPSVSGTSGSQKLPFVPRAVLKVIIDHPALAKFLHPEVEGRVPLVISGHLLESGVTPTKFGRPVRILSDRELGALPHLRFTSFEVEGSRATVRVEYKVEGVEAVFILESSASGWWRVVDAEVAES